ncbi:tetratricopeptide repeat protein [Scytonema hofmannii FACHB-248]|uniref:Tetratricopeptide repeat protein n=1 Tax=Scytonema hofmannii FACHB-248 TaxID=1842502 RepID=A0ABR8GRK7_9CYAN|nr:MULTISPECIES: tetratricopeptide repeat protein [Nostocales]MBD2605842.1 tetratricopeptide repeat protein [Scytonema hofmannii FACHB-248]
MQSVEVFISYHEKDNDLREELEKHLASLQWENIITSWSDRQIVAGQEFKGEIDKSLNQAGLILLLVSSDFIASDYHWTVEVTRALERNAAGKASVIPVLLRYADWNTPPIDKLSPLPSNRKPIKTWADRDEAFLEVVKGIRQEVKRLVANSNYSPPKEDEDTNQYNDQLDRLLRELDSKPDYKASLSSSKEDYQQKLRQYEQELIKVLQWEYPLSDHSREGLKNYQQMLKLRDEDATLIEKQVTAQELEKRQYQVTSLINEADRLREDKKFEEAALKYKAALRFDPNSVYAHNCLGIALYYQGKLDEAIARYQKALQIDPNYVTAHNNLGLALEKQGKVEEAIAYYRQALQIDPNYAFAHYNLGLALKNQGKLEQAIASYRQALQITPNYANAHIGLGNALYNQGKVDDAIASYRQALQINPNDAIAHYNLGLALNNQGKLEEAIASYRQALQINPNDAFAHNNLGLALNNQGKLEEAIAELEIAVHLDPSSNLFRENLEIYRNKKKGFLGRLFGG